MRSKTEKSSSITNFLFSLKKWTVVYIAIGSIFFMTQAHASLCNITAPSIYYSDSLSEINYIRTYTSQELRTHYDDYTGSHLLGLAGGEIGARLSADIEARKTSAQRYCMDVKNVRINFYAKPVMYIARNFPRGSCEYNAVLKHEQEHVDILRNAYAEFSAPFKIRAMDIVNKTPQLDDVMSEDIYKAKDYLLKSMGQEMNDYLDTLRAKLVLRQSEIDTAQNYQEMLSECRRWNEKLDQ